jgi:ParB family chromosome partitioning protein
VLQPITAIRTNAGIEVRDGQRRTLAAREAKLDTIPVYVLDGQAADDKTATAERIAHQIVTNDQRSALTDAQRAKGITQMLLAGVSPAKVAKKLAVDRDTVTAAASVADFPTALAALQDGQLSLAEAAALREFDDDEHAVNALLTVAGTGAFDHRVAQLRQERIAEQARADAEMTYREQGFMILTERPAWRDTSLVPAHPRQPRSHRSRRHRPGALGGADGGGTPCWSTPSPVSRSTKPTSTGAPNTTPNDNRTKALDMPTP